MARQEAQLQVKDRHRSGGWLSVYTMAYATTYCPASPRYNCLCQAPRSLISSGGHARPALDRLGVLDSDPRPSLQGKAGLRAPGKCLGIPFHPPLRRAASPINATNIGAATEKKYGNCFSDPPNVCGKHILCGGVSSGH